MIVYFLNPEHCIIYLSECHLKSLGDFFNLFKMPSITAFPRREDEIECVRKSIILDKV